MENWRVFKFGSAIPKISITENGVTFNKGVVGALGSPKYIQLLFDEENKLMAVKPCTDAKEKNKVAFCKNEKSKNVRLNHTSLKKYIENMLKVDLHINIFKCNGIFQNGVVLFDLKECKKM